MMEGKRGVSITNQIGIRDIEDTRIQRYKETFSTHRESEKERQRDMKEREKVREKERGRCLLV